MSIAATKWALDLRGVRPIPKLVLFILADHADKFGGSCFPGIDTIADETGLSRRAVIDNIKRLEKWGLLIVERRPGDGTGRRSNSYTLPLGQGAAAAHRGKVQLTQGQSAADAGQSAGDAPEPSDNHQKEPPVRGWGDCPEGVDEEAWDDWTAYKRGKPAKATVTKFCNFMQKYPPSVQRTIVDDAIRSGWKGVHPPKGATNGQNQHGRSRADVKREALTGTTQAATGNGQSQPRLVNPQ